MKKSWIRKSYFENTSDAMKSEVEKIETDEYTYPYLPQLGSFGHEYNNPGYYHQRENISKFLFCYTIDGSVDLVYSGEQYHIKAGDFFVVDLMQPTIISSGEDKWDMFFLHVESGMSQEVFDTIMEKKGIIFEDFNPSLFIKTINKMLKLRKEKKLNQLEICKHINLIFVDILKQLESSVNIPNPTLRKVVDYMNREYRNGISLNDVCQNVGITNSYLSRLFYRYYNITPLEYLFNLKSKQAVILLRRTKLSNEEIARQCGFKDGNNLYNFFKKNYGMTPTEFREKGHIHIVLSKKKGSD